MFKVSVIIPVYNREEHIIASIKSALALKEVGEIIIVDDGSTDQTGSLCLEMADKHPIIKYYTHDNYINKGVSASRNLGIQEATCDYVAFLDSDDRYLENRFFSAARLFGKYKSIDAVYDPYIVEDKDGKMSNVRGIKQYLTDDELFLYAIRRGGIGFFCTNTITIRKDVFDKIGMFDTRLEIHQDTELWLRLIYYGKVVGDNYTDPVSIIKKHNSNNSLNKNYKSKNKYKEIIIEYYYNKNISKRYMFFMLKSLIRNEYRYKGISSAFKLLWNKKKYLMKRNTSVTQ